MLSLIEEKIGRLPIFFLVLFNATRFQKSFEKISKRFGNNFCQKFWINFFVKNFGFIFLSKSLEIFCQDIHPYKIDM